MKKNKKKTIIIISIIILFAAAIMLYFILNSKNENSLTLSENKWLDSNKYDVIDIAVMNDIPSLSYDGEGIFYDYLNYVSDKLSLKFNVIPYKLGSTVDYNYKLDVVDNPKNSDIVILKDNLVLITKDKKEYLNLSDISNLKLGIMTSDKNALTSYFSLENVEYVEYNDYSELKNAFSGTNDTSEGQEESNDSSLDGIIIPKAIYTKEIIQNDYIISFQFNDVSKYFVLSTNGAKELNSILKKNYNSWEEENYTEKYNEELLNSYFKFKDISDIDRKTLDSKNYVYGFIDYGIYNHINNKEISGLSGLILEKFNEFSGISISYTQYNSISKLLDAFNSGKVDFMLNISDKENYKNSVYETVGVFNKNLIIVSGINNRYVVDDINSLRNKEVLVVKDSYQEKYLTSIGIRVKSYSNLNDLAKDFDNDDITVMDLENYNFYSSSALKDSKINYIMNSNSKYNYVINDKNENSVFEKLFNFYITYTSMNQLLSTNYDKVAYQNSNIQYILVLIIISLGIYVALDFSNHIKAMISNIKKNRKVNLSKEEKIKYIDQLTSLKNRAYLNSKIEEWDDSEVYPQAIIVIDLNNISYINDNYGREEGDKVITEAANIFIQHQLQNSEIIRTDGNEFLIYLVGYSEKQIISYIRKLNKELKGLSHGFGAATGYSIITDAIKTIDDAVNEATIDMKTNKEDIDY